MTLFKIGLIILALIGGFVGCVVFVTLLYPPRDGKEGEYDKDI